MTELKSSSRQTEPSFVIRRDWRAHCIGNALLKHTKKGQHTEKRSHREAVAAQWQLTRLEERRNSEGEGAIGESAIPLCPPVLLLISFLKDSSEDDNLNRQIIQKTEYKLQKFPLSFFCRQQVKQWPNWWSRPKTHGHTDKWLLCGKMWQLFFRFLSKVSKKKEVKLD